MIIRTWRPWLQNFLRGCSASSGSADELDVELRTTKLSEDPYPQRKIHFQTASCGEITQVEHVGPAQIGSYGGRAPPRVGVVAGHKDCRVVSKSARIDHDLVRHSVEHLHHPGLREFTLQLFGEGVGIADKQ